jgi:hypothetical protein
MVLLNNKLKIINIFLLVSILFSKTLLAGEGIFYLAPKIVYTKQYSEIGKTNWEIPGPHDVDSQEGWLNAQVEERVEKAKVMFDLKDEIDQVISNIDLLTDPAKYMSLAEKSCFVQYKYSFPAPDYVVFLTPRNVQKVTA